MLYSIVLDVVSYSVGEGEPVEALKVRALPEGGDDRDALIEFLKLYRDAVQVAIDRLWSLSEIPSIKALYRMFYSELNH